MGFTEALASSFDKKRIKDKFKFENEEITFLLQKY